MAKTPRNERSFSPSSETEARGQRKKQAKLLARAQLAVERAQRGVQRAERRLARAQKRLQAYKTQSPAPKGNIALSGTDSAVGISDIATDILEAQQLEARRLWDPQVATQLIQIYERVIGQLQPEKDTDFYASMQTSLGTAYQDLPTGDREANLTKAITCYQEALRVYTLEAMPFEYARVHANLGDAYRDLPTGDRAANLTQAINCYQKSLRVWTLEMAPFDCALIQTNLGFAYNQLPTDDRTTNLARAIAYFQQALRFCTLESAPFAYASTRANLGLAYSQLPTSDPEANLLRAIACYQEALRIWTPQTTPFEYASTQNNLGNAYSQLRTGDRAANLTQAVACFQEALRIWKPETAPLDYATTQHYLGRAYGDLPTGDRAANLKQAIACFQEALHIWTPETAPLQYAALQNDLGFAYSELLTGDRAANLKQAIACFQEALHIWTPETAPLEYARAQINLGRAYSDLSVGDHAANLKQAIACFQEALRIWKPETAPSDYAHAKSSLGRAYAQLLTGDRAANLEQAITCFQEALRVWTPETDPLQYAMVETYLGNAYSILPLGNHAANLAQAIACYQEALRFQTPETASLNYAATQNNLGNIYSELLTGDRAANLAQAIACYQEALHAWTPETAPLEYAGAQSNLGRVYGQLPMGDHRANLEQAIACFQKALRFQTLETAPLAYAITQSHLGTAYSQLTAGGRDANLAQVIACYQEALRVWTPETAPVDCRLTNRNLANLHFVRGEWKAALSAFRAALDAGERLYRSGLSTESKLTELAENAALYRNAAFTAVRCGETTEALLILERGKTRLLTEALRLHVARPTNIPDDVWRAFELARATVRSLQTEETAMLHEQRNSVQVYASRRQATQAANAALDAAIEHVRIYAPDFMREIDLRTIQALLPDEHTALVAFCVTDQGCVSFILNHNHDQAVRMVEIPTFTHADLRNLLVKRDGEGRASGGWLGAYDRYQRERGQTALKVWQETIKETLAELGPALLASTLSAVFPSIERIIFLPSAELFLLPLHAAPLSDRDSERVCDRYQISYAPSLEVLADIQARALQVVTPELYAVINPQGDPRLVFTLNEGAAVASLFLNPKVDEGRAGTKQNVITGAGGRSYVHFSCHGSYDWNDPTLSGLDLADDRLTLAELQRGEIDLSAARLVTLSACETGISDILQGSAEEYVGIPAGFLLAGVPCIVSCLWEVPDLSTALLMERFYRNHLSEGMDIAAALREAQVWVRELGVGEVAQYTEQWYRQAHQKENTELFRLMRYYRHQAEQAPTLHPFAHPYYWAAFTVNGL